PRRCRPSCATPPPPCRRIRKRSSRMGTSPISTPICCRSRKRRTTRASQCSTGSGPRLCRPSSPRKPLDDFLPPQRLDRSLAVAQLGEHLGGVLAQLRRRRRDARRRARETNRLVDDAQFPEFPALHFRRRLDVLHLGAVE